MVVVGNCTNECFDVTVNQKCKVLKTSFYNGETWYKLKDEYGNTFNSPTCFWSEEDEN